MRGPHDHGNKLEAPAVPNRYPSEGVAAMASKRELIAPKGDKRFIRRDSKGRIKESDDVGRSLAADRRKKSKTVAKPGQGDKGDRRRAARKG
jgi:hypothetical protein